MTLMRKSSSNITLSELRILGNNFVRTVPCFVKCPDRTCGDSCSSDDRHVVLNVAILCDVTYLIRCSFRELHGIALNFGRQIVERNLKHSLSTGVHPFSGHWISEYETSIDITEAKLRPRRLILARQIATRPTQFL